MIIRPLVIAATLFSSALFAETGTAMAADTTKRLGKFGDWEAYSYTEGKATVCYLATTAGKVTGGEKGKPNATYLIVTHRPGTKGMDEVSVNGVYGFKKDSKVELQVGAMKHSLFTKGDRAWADDAKADSAIVASLRRGKEAVLHASPAKGADISGAFPLSGFSDALSAADKACNIKR
jgi:hypothetical protein